MYIACFMVFPGFDIYIYVSCIEDWFKCIHAIKLAESTKTTPQTPYGDCCCIHPNPISTRSLGARPPCHLAVYPMGNNDIAWDSWAYSQTEPNSSLVHKFFSPFQFSDSSCLGLCVWGCICLPTTFPSV